MTIQPLTIQAYLDNQWLDIAKITFDDNKHITSFVYLSDYGLEHFLADNHFSVSINYPIELFEYKVDNNWLTFLDDIIPAGASRRYWLQRLDLSRHFLAEQNYELLKTATIAPIGHLRIKESITKIDQKKMHLTIHPKNLI